MISEFFNQNHEISFINYKFQSFKSLFEFYIEEKQKYITIRSDRYLYFVLKNQDLVNDKDF